MASFDERYFSAAYGADYRQRNPPYKWRSFLRHLRSVAPRGDLLDVGCAFGLFLHEALSTYRCAGCDVSPFALRGARAALPSHVPVFAARLGELPVRRRFDAVTCFDVLEHVPDLPAALADVRRALRPGGVLCATMPVYDGPLGALVDRLDHDETHVHRRSRDFWLRSLQNGYVVRRFVGVWRYFAFGRWYVNVTSRAMRRVTPAILIVAERTEDA